MERVEITISQGAVQSISCPSGVSVYIRDYDVNGVDEYDGLDIRTDEDGVRFQHIEFTRKPVLPRSKPGTRPDRKQEPKRRS